MKHLKKFNEAISDIPTYNKGEVVIWVRRDVDISDNTIKDIAKKLGYELLGEGYDKGFIIKCEPGQEQQCGSDFVDNYPEFFESYEREDIKDKHLYDECENIIDDIEDIRDSIGTLNKFGRSQLPNNWNDEIDNIISKLENIKKN